MLEPNLHLILFIVAAFVPKIAFPKWKDWAFVVFGPLVVAVVMFIIVGMVSNRSLGQDSLVLGVMLAACMYYGFLLYFFLLPMIVLIRRKNGESKLIK